MDLYGAFSDRLRVLKEALSIANKQAFTWQRFEASVRAALNASPRTTDIVDGHSGYPSLPSALGSELQKTLFRVEACRALLESVDALPVRGSFGQATQVGGSAPITRIERRPDCFVGHARPRDGRLATTQSPPSPER
jgi:hypothetical protein